MGDCFFLALEASTKSSPEDVRDMVCTWLRTSGLRHPSSRNASSLLAGGVVDEWDVDAVVQSLPHAFPHGLCVLHAPDRCCVYYEPHKLPRLLPWTSDQLFDILQWCTAALLYTEEAGPDSGPGHFEKVCLDWLPMRGRPCSVSIAGSSVTGVVRLRGGMDSRDRPTQLQQLAAMGIPVALARTALQRFPDNLDAAADWATSSAARHVRLRTAWPREAPASSSPGLPPRSLERDAFVVDEDAVDTVPHHSLALPATRSASLSSELDSGPEDRAGLPDAGAIPLAQIPPPMSQPDFTNDASAEVYHYFKMVAAAPLEVSCSMEFWSRIPLYSQYICARSLKDVVSETLESVEASRCLDLSVEAAGELDRHLGLTSLLPLAVMAAYLHHGAGMPDVFVYDLFMACLASCQNRQVSIALYADKSHRFKTKARWWACPTGDPNAGKSPTCSLVLECFERCVHNHRDVFYDDDHWTGVGNNGRIQERLRKLSGVLLLIGPEAKPILDPKFPSAGTTDVGKFLDVTRWLESANGGKFEWGTGAEEKQVRSRAQKVEHANSSRPVPAAGSMAPPDPVEPTSLRAQFDELLQSFGELPASTVDQVRAFREQLPSQPPGTQLQPLVFNTTNVNLCLYQQYNLLKKWWAPTEANHECGFSARIIMTPTQRAIVDKSTDLLDSRPAEALMQHCWFRAAQRWGPQVQRRDWLWTTSTEAQRAVRELYYGLHEISQREGWRSATKSSLGKMEYHVPANALLVALCENVFSDSEGQSVSDHALKCGMYHFARRVVLSCVVVDTEASQCRGSRDVGGSKGSEQKSDAVRILLACTKDPITMTDISQKVASLRGQEQYQARLSALTRLQTLGCGQLRETRRRPGQSCMDVAFYRNPLSPQIATLLSVLGVPSTAWPSSSHAPALPSLPPMSGAGRGMKRPAAKAVAGRPAPKAKASAKRPAGQLSRTTGATTKWYRNMTDSHVKELTCSRARCPTAGNITAVLQAAVEGHQGTPDTPLPAKIAAYPMFREGSFKLRCQDCKPKTCAWTGFAVYIEASREVEVWVSASSEHGEPREAQSKRGRKRKHEVRFSEFLGGWKHGGAAWSGKNLQQQVKQFFLTKPPREAMRVQTRLCRLKNKMYLRCTFQCNSHETTSGVQCPWQGEAEYDIEGRKIRITGDHPEKHAANVRKTASGISTAQLRLLQSQPGGLCGGDAYDILCNPRAAGPGSPLPSPPKKSFLVGWAKRRNAKLKTKKKPRAELWEEKDFHAFVARLKAATDRPDFDNRTFDGLLPVDFVIDGVNTCIPLLCPTLIKETFARLSNPEYVKLCLDGTYRLLFGNYAVLTVGVLSKHWSQWSKESPHKPCASTFNEVGFAIAHKESEQSYSSVVSAIYKVAEEVGAPATLDAVRQWHADMHLGIRKARERMAAGAVAVDDWAHVVGTTAPHGMGGIRKLLAERLQGVDVAEKSRRLKFIMSWVYASRTLPARLFHVVWQSLLKVMHNEWGCHEAAAATADHYLCEEGDERGRFFTARWRACYDRLQPGSACGSAPQESWHKHVLKRVTDGHSIRTPDALAEDLQTIVRSRLQFLRTENPVLHDWPGSDASVDLTCLSDDAALGVKGRTCAQTLLAQSPWQTWLDSEGTSWFFFPRSLLKKDDAASAPKVPKYVHRAVEPLPPDTVRLMAEAFSARDEAHLRSALQSLGVTKTERGAAEICDWPRAKEIFGRWTLVAVGPHAERYWKSVPGERATNAGNIHSRGLCSCHEAALHGPCEHLYAALLHLQQPQLSSKVCMAPRKKAGRPPGAALLRSDKPQGRTLPGPCVVAPAATASPSHSAIPEDVLSVLSVVCPEAVLPVRAGRLQALGILSLEDLKLLSERHLRQDAGFSLPEALKLLQLLHPNQPSSTTAKAKTSAVGALRPVAAKAAAKRSVPTTPSLTSQVMTNVMAGTDPAAWSLTHRQAPAAQEVVRQAPVRTAEDQALLASLSHDILWEMAWDSRGAASSARPKGPGNFPTLRSLANHFGVKAVTCPQPCGFPCQTRKSRKSVEKE